MKHLAWAGSTTLKTNKVGHFKKQIIRDLEKMNQETKVLGNSYTIP